MKHFDVIVVGGGPAGMFAAGFAALQGARVLLLEKNRRCGAKLLITGKGRCNLTCGETDPRKLSEQFGAAGKSLLTALYAFGVEDTIAFFERHGLPTRVERGGRVFPAGGDAAAVQKVLEQFLADSGVELRSGCRVLSLTHHDGQLQSLVTSQGEFSATTFVIATGGLSYPETGCTGDGYAWAAASGHQLVKPQPALVPVFLAEDWTAEMVHFNLKNVRLEVRQQGRKLDERFGEAFFTRNGIGGPIVLDMSAAIGAALEQGPVTLVLDLKPAVDRELFDKRLQRELAAHNNRAFANALGGLLPKDMIPVFIRLSGIDPAKKCHSVSRQERGQLLKLFKELTMTVTGIGDFKKAIVTAGGVALGDIDMRTMRSKKVANLFFAGEMIDLDAPTGGYNLQLCWSTGYLAGTSAAQASFG